MAMVGEEESEGAVSCGKNGDQRSQVQPRDVKAPSQLHPTSLRSDSSARRNTEFLLALFRYPLSLVIPSVQLAGALYASTFRFRSALAYKHSLTPPTTRRF